MSHAALILSLPVWSNGWNYSGNLPIVQFGVPTGIGPTLEGSGRHSVSRMTCRATRRSALLLNIVRRSLHRVDHQHIHHFACGFELESELFL